VVLLINTGQLEHLIKLALYTGYIKGEKPVSLLITASVESGKTELVKKFSNNKGIVYLTDCTAYGITKNFLPELELGKIKHIIIPDLIVPLSKQKATVKSFISFLNAIIEEGVVEIQTYAISMKKENIRCGIITTIARKELNDSRHRWSSMGFISRILPVSYSYSQDTVMKILDSIARREYYNEEKQKLKFPKKEKHIKLPVDIAKELIPFSEQFGKAEQVYGFRLQKQLQVLLEASALMDDRKVVTIDDVNILKKLLEFVNLDYKQI